MKVVKTEDGRYAIETPTVRSTRRYDSRDLAVKVAERIAPKFGMAYEA
jgi:hypothetical protein